MSFLLDDRAALRRAFYALTGTASGDDALEEHDSESNETIHRALQFGLWNAQRYLLEVGMRSRWVSSSSAITSWSGTEAADGGRYTSLPSDFLRLAGDERVSALREADGTRWGQQIPDEQFFSRQGDYFTLKNEQLWITRLAEPPTTLYLDYHHRHATLESDDTAIDFPTELRPLIVAEAAMFAKNDDWLPGGPEMETKIEKNWGYWRTEAAKAARRTRQPLMNRPKKVVGNRWFV